MTTRNKKPGSDSKSTISTEAADKKLRTLEKEADKERGRKPGSQSNQSDRHNTGRGGGK